MDTAHTARTLYVDTITPLTPAQLVSVLTPAELSDVVNGRVRLGSDREQDVAIWNAAIDRENGYAA